ncbi:MAG: hypothetical protein ACYDA1_01755 [Vulcanimicrobiaceae bacterium]
MDRRPVLAVIENAHIVVNAKPADLLARAEELGVVALASIISTSDLAAKVGAADKVGQILRAYKNAVFLT